MNKTEIKIKGMHCRSCELLIEERLKEIPEVKNVQVSYKKKNAFVYSKHPVSDKELIAAVEEAGYAVGIDDKRSWISLDPKVYKDLGISAVIIIIVYFIARSLGLFSISVGSGNPSSLLIILLIGLTAGLSTCMAMVGGLILGISARHAEKHPEATPLQRFRPHLFFNIGRISSYFLLGGVIGLVGKAFQFSGTTLGFLTIIVGVVMLFLGFQLTELFPRLMNISITLPSGISKALGIKNQHEKEYSHYNSIITGALTFFLPCGFTQAMQLYAMSTGSFLSGALIMGTFALGTAPGLLSIGGLTSVIKGTFAKKFFKFAGLVVIALAIFNISNGFNLTGITAKLSSIRINNSTTDDGPSVKIENGVQTVNMTQTSSGYTPNKFTIKKGIPVKWIVNSTNPNSCAASLRSEKLDIHTFLKAGENVFEFTPQETGTIPFSCSMGMYGGQFNVIENDSSDSNNSAPAASGASSSSQTVQPSTPSAGAKKDVDPNVQVIKTAYTYKNDIQPNKFEVLHGVPVRFEVEVKDDGSGCMSSITIPDLVTDFYDLKKGKNITFNFTPEKAGKYYITCAMGAPRGTITVQ